MRNVSVTAAACASATVGASSWSTKWSGTNSVEKPAPSTRRASSVKSIADFVLCTMAPNRNARLPPIGRRSYECGSGRARGAETAEAAFGVVERVDLAPDDGLDALNHQLSDAITRSNLERLRRIGVDQQHPDLVAVAGIDEPRRVEARDAVLEREARTRLHEPRVPLGDRDRDAGRDRGTPTARLQHRALARV